MKAANDERSDEMMDEKRAASLLGVSAGCLRTWRMRKQGPPFYKLAHRCIRYKLSEVMEFVDSTQVITSNKLPHQAR